MQKKQVRINKTKSLSTNREQARSAPDKLSIYYYLILAVICFAVHCQTITFNFTHFDDDSIIIGKQPFLSKIYNIPEAFRRDAMLEQNFSDFYRPLQTVTFIIDNQLSQCKASAYHLTNMILYCITCTFILLLLRTIFPLFPGMMLFAAVLAFSVNPFFVQAAAWIPARGDLLLSLFSVISCISLLNFDKNNKPIYLIFHFLSFVLALFSKETAVMLPLVFLSFIVIGKKRQQLVRQVVPIIIAWSVFIGIYLMIRSAAIGNAPKIAMQFLQLLSNWRVIPEMLAKFVFPFQLSPIPAFNSFFLIIGIVIILLIIGKSLWSRQNPLPVFQGALWFVVLNLPAMTFSNKASTGYDYLCHRGFLPLIGALIIIISILPIKWHRSKIFWSCTVLMILIFLFLTIPYEKIFSNPWDFYNAAVRTNPKSPIAFIGRGVLKSDMNDVQGAFMDYNRALQLCPTDQFGLIYRANIVAQMGDTLSAFKDFSALIHMYSKWAEPYLDRGKWRLTEGNIAGAKEDFEKALQLDSTYSDAYNNMGTVYLMQQDTSKAEKYYLKAISFNQSHADALYNYGLVRVWYNDLNNACMAWKKAASFGSKPAEQSLFKYCRQ